MSIRFYVSYWGSKKSTVDDFMYKQVSRDFNFTIFIRKIRTSMTTEQCVNNVYGMEEDSSVMTCG